MIVFLLSLASVLVDQKKNGLLPPQGKLFLGHYCTLKFDKLFPNHRYYYYSDYPTSKLKSVIEMFPEVNKEIKIPYGGRKENLQFWIFPEKSLAKYETRIALLDALLEEKVEGGYKLKFDTVLRLYPAEQITWLRTDHYTVTSLDEESKTIKYTVERRNQGPDKR